MKIVIRSTQVIVALLFIISGLVKANDPLGLSYKMEEFFEIWNTGLGNGNFFAKNMLISFFSFLQKLGTRSAITPVFVLYSYSLPG